MIHEKNEGKLNVNSDHRESKVCMRYNARKKKNTTRQFGVQIYI